MKTLFIPAKINYEINEKKSSVAETPKKFSVGLFNSIQRRRRKKNSF